VRKSSLGTYGVILVAKQEKVVCLMGPANGICAMERNVSTALNGTGDAALPKSELIAG
jgi:hypothetical protein